MPPAQNLELACEARSPLTRDWLVSVNLQACIMQNILSMARAPAPTTEGLQVMYARLWISTSQSHTHWDDLYVLRLKVTLGYQTALVSKQQY